MLLLTQSCMQIFSSKKIPITALLKFLISKGLEPTPGMTKNDLCLAFKMLVESQPDYYKSPIQPSQMSIQPSQIPVQPIQMSVQPAQMSIQPTQMPIQPGQMPFANNMMALSQNNNMMHYQPCQPQIQQVCIFIYISKCLIGLLL